MGHINKEGHNLPKNTPSMVKTNPDAGLYTHSLPYIEQAAGAAVSQSAVVSAPP